MRAVMTALDKVAEAAGRFGGVLLSPAVAIATRLRGVRLLHAEGQTYTADAFADAGELRLRPLAERLSGAALVRLSAALWRGREWPDILGLSLRFFGRPKVRPDATGIQDLLLATAPSVAGLPLGFVTTDPHDFLANRYNGLAPFDLDGAGHVSLRAGWHQPAPAGNSRFERLMAAVVTERAEMLLELRAEAAPRWTSLLRIRLRVPTLFDDRTTRFSPFNDTAGLRPTGFVHALRRAPYSAGQEASGARMPADAGKGLEPPTRSRGRR